LFDFSLPDTEVIDFLAKQKEIDGKMALPYPELF